MAAEWIALYNIIRDREYCITEVGRNEKSDLVRKGALKFRENLLAEGRDNGMLSAERYTPYLHALLHHLPNQILSLPLGIDIMDLSASGIEAINKQTKTAAK